MAAGGTCQYYGSPIRMSHSFGLARSSTQSKSVVATWSKTKCAFHTGSTLYSCSHSVRHHTSTASPASPTRTAANSSILGRISSSAGKGRIRARLWGWSTAPMAGTPGRELSRECPDRNSPGGCHSLHRIGV